VASRLSVGPINNIAAIKDCYKELLTLETYRHAVEKSTANEESVASRLAAAKSAFEKVP